QRRKNTFVPFCETLEDLRVPSGTGLLHSASLQYMGHRYARHHHHHRGHQVVVQAPTLPPSTSGGGSAVGGGLSLSALGLAVEQWAQSLVGQSAVGSGQCTDLVQQALSNAGAQSWFNYDVYGNLVANDNPYTAPYVWGTLIATYNAGDSTAILNSVEP